MTPAGLVEQRVADIATRFLPALDAPIDRHTPIEGLGLDSLTSIEITAALEEEFGCDLPPDLLLECATPGDVARRILRLRTPGQTAHADPFAQMEDDARLPADVVPPAAAGRTTTDLRQARRILLTGATGFLGRALLDEILRSSGADVVCLARHPDRLEGVARGTRRVGVVQGDLTHPRLGLSAAASSILQRQVDAVVHCAADVNWVFPYAALRPANVLGTLELLRFAAVRGVPLHFVSSISACYSLDGARDVDEDYDGLPGVRGIHLGYAQSKVVAESLVRQAAGRGLQAKIYRPALLSGHSGSGDYNADDMIALLVRGCVSMGTAPDLDWQMDAVPVDFAARSILQLSGSPLATAHIVHPRPRHWREVVLWMRMYGYEVRLVPYHAWLRDLDAATTDASRAHPLRPLRGFFLTRQARARGLTLPEIYEDSRRATARADRTNEMLAAAGLTYPALDADLLDLYFSAFRSCGELPPPAGCRAQARPSSRTPSRELVSELLGRRLAEVETLDTGSDHSIVSELTAWHSGQGVGLFRVRVTEECGTSNVVRIKAKAHDSAVVAVGAALAAVVDTRVGQAYARWGDRIGFAASHLREVGIYRQTDERFVRHAPRLLGAVADPARRVWTMALEEITGALPVGRAGERWPSAHIAAALAGLAPLHAIWLGREAELRQQPWTGFAQTAGTMCEMSELWTALARHASPAFSSWASPDIGSIHQRLVERVGDWWPAMAAGPRTLIHNDFNPRNICLRPDAGGGPPRLCAYDWELAAAGAPQRDLAEFLCFTLGPSASREDVEHWIEWYRARLEQESATSIDATTWRRGFAAGLYDFLISRLASYAMVNRVRRQRFLPDVVATWRRIYGIVPLEDAL